MALRPLAFSVRLRDKEKGRTLRVQNDPKNAQRFLLEDVREGEPTRVRSFSSLPEAVQDAAAVWRKRLH
jgi:hypothetical protein